MTLLAWTAALELQHPTLDATHREFVEHLDALDAAVQAERELPDILTALSALIAHTEAHFGMEEGWMAATGFAPENCHSRQHAMVLDVLRQVQAHTLSTQDLAPLRHLLTELAQWFPAHAEMMDAALVFTMQQLGFDPTTGHCERRPEGEAITSCGSTTCS